VAYWRSLAFGRLRSRLAVLEPEITAMLEASGKAIQNERIDPLVSLSYDRDMLNLRRELNELLVSLSSAPEQLKQLIGVPQSFAMRLRPSPQTRFGRLLAKPADADVSEAFKSRYELRQVMYDERITDNEVYATLAQLLPGISLSGGLNHDSNSFLMNANWLSWGSAVAWNLINLAKIPRDLDVVEAQHKVNRQQALAMAVSITMQVRIARARIGMLRRSANDADTLAGVQRKLLAQVQAGASVGTIAPQSQTKERLATLLADVRADLAHVELESAGGVYLTTLGRDALSDLDTRTRSVSELAATLRAYPATGPAATGRKQNKVASK
jgi:hypothetical protein